MPVYPDGKSTLIIRHVAWFALARHQAPSSALGVLSPTAWRILQCDQHADLDISYLAQRRLVYPPVPMALGLGKISRDPNACAPHGCISRADRYRLLAPLLARPLLSVLKALARVEATFQAAMPTIACPMAVVYPALRQTFEPRMMSSSPDVDSGGEEAGGAGDSASSPRRTDDNGDGDADVPPLWRLSLENVDIRGGGGSAAGFLTGGSALRSPTSSAAAASAGMPQPITISAVLAAPVGDAGRESGVTFIVDVPAPELCLGGGMQSDHQAHRSGVTARRLQLSYGGGRGGADSSSQSFHAKSDTADDDAAPREFVEAEDSGSPDVMMPASPASFSQPFVGGGGGAVSAGASTGSSIQVIAVIEFIGPCLLSGAAPSIAADILWRPPGIAHDPRRNALLLFLSRLAGELQPDSWFWTHSTSPRLVGYGSYPTLLLPDNTELQCPAPVALDRGETLLARARLLDVLDLLDSPPILQELAAGQLDSAVILQVSLRQVHRALMWCAAANADAPVDERLAREIRAAGILLGDDDELQDGSSRRGDFYANSYDDDENNDDAPALSSLCPAAFCAPLINFSFPVSPHRSGLLRLGHMNLADAVSVTIDGVADRGGRLKMSIASSAVVPALTDVGLTTVTASGADVVFNVAMSIDLAVAMSSSEGGGDSAEFVAVGDGCDSSPTTAAAVAGQPPPPLAHVRVSGIVAPEKEGGGRAVLSHLRSATVSRIRLAMVLDPRTLVSRDLSLIGELHLGEGVGDPSVMPDGASLFSPPPGALESMVWVLAVQGDSSTSSGSNSDAGTVATFEAHAERLSIHTLRVLSRSSVNLGRTCASSLSAASEASSNGGGYGGRGGGADAVSFGPLQHPLVASPYFRDVRLITPRLTATGVRHLLSLSQNGSDDDRRHRGGGSGSVATALGMAASSSSPFFSGAFSKRPSVPSAVLPSRAMSFLASIIAAPPQSSSDLPRPSHAIGDGAAQEDEYRAARKFLFSQQLCDRTVSDEAYSSAAGEAIALHTEIRCLAQLRAGDSAGVESVLLRGRWSSSASSIAAWTSDDAFQSPLPPLASSPNLVTLQGSSSSTLPGNEGTLQRQWLLTLLPHSAPQRVGYDTVAAAFPVVVEVTTASATTTVQARRSGRPTTSSSALRFVHHCQRYIPSFGDAFYGGIENEDETDGGGAEEGPLRAEVPTRPLLTVHHDWCDRRATAFDCAYLTVASDGGATLSLFRENAADQPAAAAASSLRASSAALHLRSFGPFRGDGQTLWTPLDD